MRNGFFTTLAAILAVTIIGATTALLYIAPRLSPQPQPLSIPLITEPNNSAATTPRNTPSSANQFQNAPIPQVAEQTPQIPPPLPPQALQRPIQKQQLTSEAPPPPRLPDQLPPTISLQAKTPPPTTVAVQQPSPQAQAKVLAIAQSVNKDAPALQQQSKTALATAEIPKPQNLLQKIQSISPSSDLVPETLGAFFNEFDFNNDGALAIDEAASFYYWVERNIKYRFDDEDVRNVPKNILVGDGRPGPDYRQSPTETVAERAGDCEDTSTLEAAFYQYWGIPAYIAAVNAKDPKFVDHAITIVRIEGNLNTFVDLLGKLMYWNFQPKQEIISWEGQSIPSGNYMLIDNAYSNNFGFLTSGIKPDAFTMQAVLPADAPFGAGWDYFVDNINLSWSN